MGIHGIEGATHFSNPVQALELTLRYYASSDETSKIQFGRRASYNLVASSSQAAISGHSCFCDSLAILRARSYLVVSSRTFLKKKILWVDRSPMSIHLGASSSTSGNELVQSISVRARCSLSSLQESFSVCSGVDASFLLPHDIDVFFNGIMKVVSSGTYSFVRWMYFVVANRFLLRKWCPVLLFHLAQGFPWWWWEDR